jgi:hypothetical protein
MAVIVPGTPHAGINRYEIRGRSGVLRSGSRMVTELGEWRAESLPDGTRLVLDLDFGRDGLRGPATIVASEPLVIDMTQEA